MSYIKVKVDLRHLVPIEKYFKVKHCVTVELTFYIKINEILKFVVKYCKKVILNFKKNIMYYNTTFPLFI